MQLKARNGTDCGQALVDERKLKLAQTLLSKARTTERRLDQRLLVAAAFTTVMQSSPIVVGGTAEEYWTRDEYQPTDLDLIPGPSLADEAAFKEIGLEKEGRHWVSKDLPVATEFPHDTSFEVMRTSHIAVGGVDVKVIGVDDLYLERLGQTTMSESTDHVHFASVLAVAVANWGQLDWSYIEKRIRDTIASNPRLGASLMKMHRICRRVARKELARARAEAL
ncbi:MAG TPA: hypothetical protein VGX27_14870 [Candidatus Dormibacteraeota bacterium]|nr:hypothetical protein [Candidatus Dormibacteraeota bacterium]